MSNLLEKASIITTPSAYSSGFIHSVKPEQSLGSELITNGDFDTDSDWTKASGTTISDDKLNITAASSNDRTFQNAGLVQGKNYKVDFEVSNYNGGSLSVLMGGSTTPNIGNITANNIYSFYQKSLGANSFFYFKGNLLDASITNVSVREVIDADFTFTRNNIGTRVNSSGNIESVGVDLPRIDYTDGSGSWLLEPQTTNLITYSEDFSQWTLGGDTTIESGYLAPDGTNNAYKISGTDNNIKLTVANLLGTSQRTIFARTVSGTGTAKLLTHRNNTNNLFSITEQWQRFKINSTTVSTSDSTFFGIDFRGGGLSEIILWGANATNNQDFETSYIPTSGSPQTRSQDLAENAGNSDLISSTEGVLYVEIAALANDNTRKAISINNGGLTDYLFFRYIPTSGSSNNRFQIIFRSGGNNIVNQMFDLANNLDFNKIAFSYKLNEFKTFVNGVQIGSTVTSGIVFNQTINSLDFDEFNGTNNFFGKAKCVAVFKEALTDAELICLTTI